MAWLHKDGQRCNHGDHGSVLPFDEFTWLQNTPGFSSASEAGTQCSADLMPQMYTGTTKVIGDLTMVEYDFVGTIKTYLVSLSTTDNDVIIIDVNAVCNHCHAKACTLRVPLQDVVQYYQLVSAWQYANGTNATYSNSRFGALWTYQNSDGKQRVFAFANTGIGVWEIVLESISTVTLQNLYVS